MSKWIIIWDAGYGEEAEIIEAKNEVEADKAAYEAWLNEVENNADYRAEPYTKVLAENYGLDE